MTPQVPKIAARLSEAQRRYLTELAEWRKPIVWAQERWMTFPPANVHRVLMKFGLVDGSGQILTDGLAVRTYLQENPHE